MSARAKLMLQLDEPHLAAQSLAPDDDGFLETAATEGGLCLVANSDSAMGLLRTLDDALGCLRATGIE